MMVDRFKGLHKPIKMDIEGSVTLLTIGYVARVLGRSTWTIKHWTKIGLLPEAAFIANPNDTRTRRRLYPEPFVKCLDEIAEHGYLGRRMDRAQWQRFRRCVRPSRPTPPQ